jgi:hypothetical protein
MNFFASPEYLDILGDVYFPTGRKRICDVAVGGMVLRVLEVDGKPVARSDFLDYHLPLSDQETRGAEQRRLFAPWVAHETIPIEEYDGVASDTVTIAPFIDWTRFKTFDDYLQLIRQRPHIKEYERRRRKFIQAHGPVQFTYIDKGDDVLPLARQWKSQQLKQTGLPDWFATPKNVAFFDAMAARGALISSTLRCEGRLIAVFLGAVCDGRMSGWLFTYSPDPELRKFSIGHQLLLSLLEYSHSVGHREFDFSIGPDPYKIGYATHARVLRPVGPRPLPDAVIRGARNGAKALLSKAPVLQNAARTCKRLIGRKPPVEQTPDIGAVEANGAVARAEAAQKQPTNGTQVLNGSHPAPETGPASPTSDLTTEIEARIAARLEARRSKDFAGSDRIRDELAALGVRLRDGKDPETGEPVTRWEFERPAVATSGEPMRPSA